MNAFIEQEEKMIREMVDKVIASGANVLFCQKGIDDLAQHYLTRAGILAVKREMCIRDRINLIKNINI